MEAPVSVSLGVVRSLPTKLEKLLSPEAEADHGLRLHDGEKKKIRLIKDSLQELIDKYLMEPSEVEVPAAAARCWVKEVRELSYDIEDFLDELVHGYHAGPKNPHGMIPRRRQGQSRSRWVADEGSKFGARLRDAIQRHKSYNLDRCRRLASSSSSEEHPLPALYGSAMAHLVGIDSSTEKLQGWLTGDEERKLRMVSIVGLGGVGKTTLAKELYHKIKSQFECQAFARTSQMPDMRKLLSSILLQIRLERPPDDSELSNLIDTIRAHLHHKKYLIVIDDLWAPSTWDVICRALPDDECCSRVLVTTEIDLVSQRCCGHNSEYIFKMGPLTDDESRKLFFSRFPGEQSESCYQSEVPFEIIRRCGGSPLATVAISSLLARKHNLIEQCNYIRKSLRYNLRKNPGMEGMKEVLSICYNNLPDRLKACMLYLSTYKEDHMIWKDDLVKQWIAEGFICAKEGNNMEDVASTYFDELISRGMIQPADISYNGEVLSCAVHYMILHLIRYKSTEENFVTAINPSQTKIKLADKVRRLSLLFGDADDAEPPENLRLTQVRSLVFHGLFKSLPSIVEFQHLRVLILHLCGDQDNISFDLTTLCRIFRLKYLEIVCNVTVNLKTKMQGLKYLETLKIDSRLSEVPQDVVHLPGLLHLSLAGDTKLPNGIEGLATIQTLGCFDLARSSEDNVLSLGELINIWDLRLTCSESEPDSLKKNMEHLCSVLSKLRNLKSLTLLAAGSYDENTVEANIPSNYISCDLSNVHSPPTLLQKLELMPRICILSVLPRWIGKLCLLNSLKIEVMGLSGGDICILEGLPALAALSLYVRTAPAERIIFHMEGFPNLKYFVFICPALCVGFMEGAMPKVRSLMVGFNANSVAKYSMMEAGLQNLAGLEVFSAKIGGAGSGDFSRDAVQSALEDTFRQNKSPPIVRIQLVDWDFYSHKEISTASTTQQAAEEAWALYSDKEFSTASATQQTAGEGWDVHSDEEISTESASQQTSKEVWAAHSDNEISTASATTQHTGKEGWDVHNNEEISTASASQQTEKEGWDAHRDREIRTASASQRTAQERWAAQNEKEITTASDSQQIVEEGWAAHSEKQISTAAATQHTAEEGSTEDSQPYERRSSCGGWMLDRWRKVGTKVRIGTKSEGKDNLLWWRGLERCHVGLVSMATAQANWELEDQCVLHSNPFLGTFVGIFDGHGGAEAARYACDYLLPNLEKASPGPQGVTTDAIRKAFRDTEEGFLAFVSQHWESKPEFATVGTCCLVGVVHRGTLFVSNLGNSRAVLGTKMGPNGRIAAQQLTSEHDASLEAVRQELRAQHPDDPQVVVLKHNVWRVKGLITISRSIGDAYLKHAKYNSERIHSKFRLREPISKPILSAEPSVLAYKIQPYARFVIFASDGLWEHLSNAEAVEIVHSHPPFGSARRLIEAAFREAAKKRGMRYSHLVKIDRGVRRHFHDDISVIVLFLDDNQSVKDAAQGRGISIRCPGGGARDALC